MIFKNPMVKTSVICISINSSQLINGWWAKSLFVSQLFVTWKTFTHRSRVVYGSQRPELCHDGLCHPVIHLKQ